MNLVDDVLVKKSVVQLFGNVEPKLFEQLDSPEHIFHRRLSLVYRWVPSGAAIVRKKTINLLKSGKSNSRLIKTL